MKQQIKQHQRWRSRDRRDNGRTVDVIRVIGGNEAGEADTGRVVVFSGHRKYSMMFSTLRERYTLVLDA